MSAHDDLTNRLVTDRSLFAQDGSRIGTILDVHHGRAGGVPEWARVHAGFLGGRLTLVPLAGAVLRADGVQVPYTAQDVRQAPEVEAPELLTPEQEARLYQHYGMHVAALRGRS